MELDRWDVRGRKTGSGTVSKGIWRVFGLFHEVARIRINGD